MPDPNPPSADTTRFVWLPDPALSAASNAAAFMRVLGVSDYADMVRYGDDEPERFHDALLKHVGFRFFSAVHARDR